MMNLRMALIGVGVMGKKYAEMIIQGKASGVSLSAVVVRRTDMRNWADSLVNTDGTKPKIYETAEAMFAEPQMYDAVIIATPHKTHEEFAKKAFALGKAVLCDKPAGAAISQANNMQRAAKDNNQIYGMMFHQRMYPKYIKIKNMIQNKELGELSRIMLVNSRYLRTSHYHNSGSWRSSWNGEGGGALINQGAHILDIWQWLFGMPCEIYADIEFGKYNEFEVDDEATIQMKYNNGITGVFVLTTGEAVWEERLEVIGSRGKLLLENDTLHIWKYSEEIRDYIKAQPVNSRENLTIEEEVIDFGKCEEPYTQMIENFAQAVYNNDSSILTAPGKDAVNQLMLTNAAYYSAWNKAVIKLPLDSAEYDKAFLEACERERAAK